MIIQFEDFKVFKYMFDYQGRLNIPRRKEDRDQKKKNQLSSLSQF